jgi:hypothetical protein
MTSDAGYGPGIAAIATSQGVAGVLGRRGKTRVDRADLSIAECRTCKQDVGADREPEGVVAHDRYLDEHAQDRENDHNERSDKTKIHCAYLRG